MPPAPRTAAHTPVPRLGSGPHRLSFAQQRLWFLDRLTPGSPLHNVPLVLEITGRLDLPAPRTALQELLDRHEVLRTRFTGGHTEPRQVVDEVTDRLRVTEIAHLPEDLPPHEAPCTPVEEAVAELWANTLQVERVGVHDDFSALGGDSLTAMRAVVHLRKALGTELPIRVLFDDETLEDTALVIEDHLLAGIGKLSGEAAQALLAG